MSLLSKILEILYGIDKTEVESSDGWWETSTGAEFGAGRIKLIKELFKKINIEADEVVVHAGIFKINAPQGIGENCEVFIDDKEISKTVREVSILVTAGENIEVKLLLDVLDGEREIPNNK